MSKVAAAEAQKVLAERILARRRLLQFTKMTYPAYTPGWVHRDICRRLERFSDAVAERKSPRLMLLMPPRSGKSELASTRFPAWHLGRHPTHEIINVGYNLELPTRFSRRVRDVIKSPEFKHIFPESFMDPNSQAVEQWNMTAGGGFTAAGVGGGITGKGAHILIVDDPIKNQEEADSQLIREKLWDWYQSTAYTRLAPGGGVLIIETFWNDDDLAGRILQKMNEDPEADMFEVVKYPAISESWEYLNEETDEIVRVDEESPHLGYTLLRKPDEALHPERYPITALKRIRANLQPRIWSAMYQQNPTPDEGLYFKKEYFRYIRELPPLDECKVYTAWDFAIGEKQTNDWTVGVTLLHDIQDRLHVIDVTRFRGDSFEIVEAMISVAERFGQTKNGTYMIGVEDGQIWKAVEPLFKRRMMEKQLYIPYEPLKSFTDKIARARPLQGSMQQGRIFIPEYAPWRGQAEQELLRFPAGAHDDIVDALSWAVRLTMDKPIPKSKNAAKAPKSWKERLLGYFGGSGGSHMSA